MGDPRDPCLEGSEGIRLFSRPPFYPGDGKISGEILRGRGGEKKNAGGIQGVSR